MTRLSLLANRNRPPRAHPAHRSLSLSSHSARVSHLAQRGLSAHVSHVAQLGLSAHISHHGNVGLSAYASYLAQRGLSARVSHLGNVGLGSHLVDRDRVRLLPSNRASAVIAVTQEPSPPPQPQRIAQTCPDPNGTL
jgi:hypothetical protein